MTEALKIARQYVSSCLCRGNYWIVVSIKGLVSGEDSPDIVGSMFLDQISEDQMWDYAFLEHWEWSTATFWILQQLMSLVVHPTINGLLAWMCQNATRNCGDDFRSLKLCDMQPYELLHPNLETEVYCVLGLQEESKMANRGMQTVCAELVLHSFQSWQCLHRQLIQHTALSLPITTQRCVHSVQWPYIIITCMTITSLVRRWILIGPGTWAGSRWAILLYSAEDHDPFMMYKGSLCVWYLSSCTIQWIKSIQFILSGLRRLA